MWVATERNASAAHRAAEVAERALVELERPYVFVRFGEPGFEIRTVETPGTDELKLVSRYNGRFQMRFVNFGRSPAILTELLDTYDRVAGLAAMPYPTTRGQEQP